MNLKAKLTITFFLFAVSFLTARNITLQNLSVSHKVNGYRLVKVIDARTNKEDIGVVQVGIMNRQSQLFFSRSLEEEVLNAMKGGFFNNGKQDLIIKVNQFTINEWTTSFRETGIASINLSFMTANSDGSYVEICNTIISTNINGGDVTLRHPVNIINALNKSLVAFSRRINGNNLTASPISIAESTTPTRITLNDFEISEDLKLYEHFSDFADGLPMDASSFKMNESLDGFKLKDDKKNQITSFWGAEYRGALHLFLNKKFRPLQKDDKGFYKILSDVDQNAVGNAGFWFGLLGAAIASSATQQDRLIRLDPNLGQLDIYSISKSEVRNKKDEATNTLKSHSIVQISPFIKNKYQFNLRIDGQKQINNINRSQYFRIPLDWKEKSIEICVEGVSQCLTLEVPDHSILVRIEYKKDVLSSEVRSPKDRQIFLRNVDKNYEVQ